MPTRPTFAVVIDCRGGSAGTAKTINSVRKQIYTDWALLLLVSEIKKPRPAAGTICQVVEPSLGSCVKADYLMVLKPGERLSIDALYEFASRINRNPGVDLIYGDEDTRHLFGGFSRPFHKPDWSPDYIEYFNYLGFPVCIRTELIREHLTGLHRYDLVLRATEITAKIEHIDQVLGNTSRRSASGSRTSRHAVESDLQALNGRLVRTRRNGIALRHRVHPGCYDVQLQRVRDPFVSIVITSERDTSEPATRDESSKPFAAVVEHLRSYSTYSNFEIVIVDNKDWSNIQQGELLELGCRQVLSVDGDRSISRLRNAGAAACGGELLLFFDADLRVLTRDWIERMLAHFEKPHVGVVGAKILTPSGKIAHAGIVHTNGTPYPVSRLAGRNESGYFFSTCAPHNYSGVSGICLMTTVVLFREVAGFSERLRASYNDADFCQKIRQLERFIVYTPEVEVSLLRHPGAVVRVDHAARSIYQNQWTTEVTVDPFYNEEFLTAELPTFVPCVNGRKI